MSAPQAYQWMQGHAMQNLVGAEEALAAKVRDIGEDFIYLVFSGISSQELKRTHMAKDRCI